MPRKPLYLFSSGELSRKQNAVYFKPLNQRGKFIPVDSIEYIDVFGELSLNKRVLEFLSSHRVPLHFFNYYGFYVGSFYPREYLNSGLMIINQTRAYLNSDERLFLAKSFVWGAQRNSIGIMKTHLKNLKDDTLKGEIRDGLNELEELSERAWVAKDVNELRAIEGNFKKLYYNILFKGFIKDEDFSWTKREKRPPTNYLNAMLSFGNSLLYAEALNAIYRTHLVPQIGYLHEANRRSFSLNLDLAEVFKPLIVDTVILKLVNLRKIRREHFFEELDGILLTEEGRKIFVQAFEDRISTTITLKRNRKRSYRELLKGECYKLYRHFLGDEEYKPFMRTRW